jgi:hypothetical protein
MSEISKAKLRFGLPEDAKVVSCYEAGRDGFWIHRLLTHGGFAVTDFVVGFSTVPSRWQTFFLNLTAGIEARSIWGAPRPVAWVSARRSGQPRLKQKTKLDTAGLVDEERTIIRSQ